MVVLVGVVAAVCSSGRRVAVVVAVVVTVVAVVAVGAVGAVVVGVV